MNAAQEVLLVDSGEKLHIQRVNILRTEPDRILVNEGLRAGDKVVVSRMEVPIEGMKVRVEARGEHESNSLKTIDTSGSPDAP